jgi:Domain of unknown function (DUF3846)
MATFLRTTGESETVSPANGVNWTLPELQTLVGGYIEIARTTDGRFLVLDEEGKCGHKMKPLNRAATLIYQHGRHDPIVGDVLIVDTMLEMNGPDDEDEDD